MRDDLVCAFDRDLPELLSDSQWITVAQRLGLTRRERDVAKLICRGKTKDGISGALGISPNTVRMHCRNLFDKLGVHDRVGVVVRVVSARCRMCQEYPLTADEDRTRLSSKMSQDPH